MVLVGLISYDRLPVREYPNIDEPVVTVEHQLSRAPAPRSSRPRSPRSLEDSLAGIEGIDVHDLAQPRRAEPDHRPLHARRAIPTPPRPTCATGSSRVRGRLPDEIDEPVIAKVEADAAADHLPRRSRRDRHSPLEVTDFVDRYVKDRAAERCPAWPTCASSASGATRCASGSTATRLAAYGLTPAGRRGRAAPPERRGPGRPHREQRRASSPCVAETDLRTPEQFDDDHRRERRAAIRCACATSASVELGPEDERAVSRFNGQQRGHHSASSSRRPPTRSTSPRRCAPSCRQINEDLPAGMKLDIAYDTSVFIERLDRGGVHARSPRRSCWSCW